MAEATGRQIESLAQENRDLVRALADMVNTGIDVGADLQPHAFNELATRAIFCADEITRLARDLTSDPAHDATSHRDAAPGGKDRHPDASGGPGAGAR